MKLSGYYSFSVVLLMFLGMGMSASAQTAFGLKGGLNLTSLNVDDPESSYDSRSGYHVGIFLREKFSKVAIQPEVLLFTQSTDISSVAVGQYEFQDNFTYLSVPIMVKFYLVSGLNIHVGPQFGFLIDGERKGSFLGQSFNEDIKDYYKKSDISVSVGGGWDFPFGLNLDVRYNIGIQDINDQADGNEAKSRVFQVSVGWNFLK